MKNIKKYIGQFGNIRIFSDFTNIFDDDTLRLLLKSLSYFVKLEKAEYVSIILQAIDIFSSKKTEASSLYREIIKIGDPEQYELIFNKKEDETFGTEVNPKVFFDELREQLEEKSLNTNTQKLFKAKQVLTFIEQLYDYLDKFYESTTKKTGVDISPKLKVLYIWRCTSIIDKTSKREIINWLIKNEEEVPEKAHPKYSQYVNLFEFVKFVVNDNKFFRKRELLFDAPQLEGLASVIPPKKSLGCWGNVSQAVRDATNFPPPTIKKPKPQKTTRSTYDTFSSNHNYYYDHEEHENMSDGDMYENIYDEY
jgi:hypothetical protein